MRSSYVETNGIRLHVVDHGGNGPPLVLTPGLTANARFFDAIVAGGLGDSVRVLAVDLRGRGLSDKPDDGYSMAEHAMDIVGVVREFGYESVTMGGHSFGGLLTYYMAVHTPEFVDRCVVLDAPGEVDPTIVEQIKPSLARLESSVASFDAYLDAVKAQPYFDGWWDDDIEAYYRADVMELADGSVRARSSSDHIQQAIDATLEPDWPMLVRNVSQPTLLVRATGAFGPAGYPPILKADTAQRTVDSLADGTLVEVDGNHITAFFGGGALRTAEAIRQFMGVT